MVCASGSCELILGLDCPSQRRFLFLHFVPALYTFGPAVFSEFAFITQRSSDSVSDLWSAGSRRETARLGRVMSFLPQASLVSHASLKSTALSES